MPIDEEKRIQLERWLQDKGVRRNCIACDASGWRVGDVIAPPAAPSGGGTAVGGPSFPMVQVICENCGYVMHFASPQIGITT